MLVDMAIEALRNVIGKVGRFYGKNITKFLKTYTYEMENIQVLEKMMIETYDLIVIPKIKEKVRQLHGGVHVHAWTRFEERLRDEYFDEDSERMTNGAIL